MEGTNTVIAARAAKRFLFAHWEGGGNTPPVLAVVRRLASRGHEVRVLSDPCNREEFEYAGASFRAWSRLPQRAEKSPSSDPIRDWEVRSPLAVLGRLRDRLIVGPALAYATDVLEELRNLPSHLVVTSEMLLGVMAAAESANVPCVAVSANIFVYPLPGVPPFGPGLQPASGLWGKVRDRLVQTFSMQVFGRGTAAFNLTRRALNLPELSHPLEQVSRVTKHLVLTSAAFDFPATSLPKNVVYAGPELDDPPWVKPWSSPWPESDSRPLILVAFSTTFQKQIGVLQRIIEALSMMNVRAVVTTGPALSVSDLPWSSNVHVCASAPHNQVLSKTAAVVTHAGHGTVIRALAAGVPLLCLPMGRDQNDNAARVVARGAGLRLKATARVGVIRNALLNLLESPNFIESAKKLGTKIAEDARDSIAVQVLEESAAAQKDGQQCAE
jgi:MGT family glycosyltransferase